MQDQLIAAVFERSSHESYSGMKIKILGVTSKVISTVRLQQFFDLEISPFFVTQLLRPVGASEQVQQEDDEKHLQKHMLLWKILLPVGTGRLCNSQVGLKVALFDSVTEDDLVNARRISAASNFFSHGISFSFHYDQAKERKAFKMAPFSKTRVK